MYDTSYAATRCTLRSGSSCWVAMPMLSGKRVLLSSPDTLSGNVRSEWGWREGRGWAHLRGGVWCRRRHTRWTCATTFACCPSSSSSVRSLRPLGFWGQEWKMENFIIHRILHKHSTSALLCTHFPPLSSWLFRSHLVDHSPPQGVRHCKGQSRLCLVSVVWFPRPALHRPSPASSSRSW